MRKVEKIKKICPMCKKEFGVYPYKIKEGKGIYCSKSCYVNAHPKIKKICLLCKKVFYVITARHKAKYCSRNCHNKSLIGCSSWNKGTKGIMKPNKTSFKKGQKPFNWKNGIKRHGAGYILIHSPKHPFQDDQKYVFEHRLVAEKYLGRYLDPKEVVHHINGIKLDNRPQNLFVFENNIEHLRFHILSKSNPFLKTFLTSNLI